MAEATGYRLQLDKVNTFDSPALMEVDSSYSGLPISFYDANDICTWYWRVKALFAEGEYEARLYAGNARVSLKRIRQKYFDPRLGIESGDFDARWDRCGFVSYSQVSIKVDWPTFRSIRGNVGGRTEDEVLRRVAQTVINHVIDAYRRVTQEPWVRRVTERDIFELEGELMRSDALHPESLFTDVSNQQMLLFEDLSG